MSVQVSQKILVSKDSTTSKTSTSAKTWASHLGSGRQFQPSDFPHTVCDRQTATQTTSCGRNFTFAAFRMPSFRKGGIPCVAQGKTGPHIELRHSPTISSTRRGQLHVVAAPRRGLHGTKRKARLGCSSKGSKTRRSKGKTPRTWRCSSKCHTDLFLLARLMKASETYETVQNEAPVAPNPILLASLRTN